MDVGAALPDRCVACNEPAAKRVSRTLYWSPTAWRYFGIICPLLLLWGGMALGIPMLALLFWPVLIVLGIANYFVRRKLSLDLAVCERHRRLRNVLRALSVASLVGIVFIFMQLPDSWPFLVAAVVLILALAIAQGFVGVQSISLKKLDPQHAWLGGTGKTFREALPELPGA